MSCFEALVAAKCLPRYSLRQGATSRRPPHTNPVDFGCRYGHRSCREQPGSSILHYIPSTTKRQDQAARQSHLCVALEFLFTATCRSGHRQAAHRNEITKVVAVCTRCNTGVANSAQSMALPIPTNVEAAERLFGLIPACSVGVVLETHAEAEPEGVTHSTDRCYSWHHPHPPGPV